ncbi:MAG: LapA family protein [Rhizobiales bacterium]|nr:LapA family protein [Hyphomicrobiales bacterium]
MVRKLVATFVVLPLGILLVAFAVANRHPVTVSFDPLGSGAPALSASLPLFLVILVVLATGVVAGGVASWLRQGRARRRARRLDGEVKALRSECASLRNEISARESAERARDMDAGLPAPVAAVPPATNAAA